MKFVIATLVAGGTVFAANLPNPAYDECVLVDPIITTETPTFVNPEPDATAMQLIVYCGQRVQTTSGTYINQQAFKLINIDVDQAQLILRAAEDIAADGDVFIEGDG